MSSALTSIIYADDPEHVFTFSNFIEYPAPKDIADAKPYLYFSLGIMFKGSRGGIILNDVRLVGGMFQNPYHRTQYRSRAQAYLNPVMAEAVANAWEAAVTPLMPKWKLMGGAEAGLAFDTEKLAKIMDAPYKVWTKEKTEQSRRDRAVKKVGIV